MSEIFAGMNPDRRSFIQRLVGMAGFAVPTVRSVLIGSATVAAVTPALAQPMQTTVTTAIPITTAPPSQGQAPELDPGAAVSAVALLTTGVVMARGSRLASDVSPVGKTADKTEAGCEQEEP